MGSVSHLHAHCASCTHRLVEIGCGSGYVICSAALLLKTLGIRAHVCATDHSQAAASAAHATLQAHQVGMLRQGFRFTCKKSQIKANIYLLQVSDVDIIMTDLLSGLDGLMGKVDVLVGAWV